MMVLRATMYPSWRVCRITRNFPDTAAGTFITATSIGTSLVSSTTITSESASPRAASDTRHSRSDAGRFLVTTPTVRRLSRMGEERPLVDRALVDGERRARRLCPAHVVHAPDRGVSQPSPQRRVGEQALERGRERRGVARRHDQP